MIWLLIGAVLLGAAAGLARPAKGRHLARPPLRHPDLLFVAVAGHFLSWLLPSPVSTLLLGISLAALLVAVAGNLDMVGFGVMSVGIGLNLLTVLVHGGVPVDPDALVAAGLADPAEVGSVDLLGGRHLADGGFQLLGDVIPVSAVSTVVSFGDLIILVGLAATVANVCRRSMKQAELQSTMAPTAAHDWGEAPFPSPVSGFQYSEKPDLIIALDSEVASDAATDREVDDDRELVAANQHR